MMDTKSLLKKQEFPGYCSTRGNYRKPRRTDKFAARWPVSGGAISSDYADSVCTILNSYSVPVPVLRAVKLKEIKGTNIFYGTRNTGTEHRDFSTHHSPFDLIGITTHFHLSKNTYFLIGRTTHFLFSFQKGLDFPLGVMVYIFLLFRENRQC